MTDLAAEFADIAVDDAAIPLETVLAPRSEEEAAAVLAAAARSATAIVPWGGGSQQGLGARVDAAVAVLTRHLPNHVEWSPDDLTVVAGAGVKIADLERQLAGGGQSAVLSETPGSGTVGGAVATGLSGWRRYRYGPTRDRILEVRLVTGDGRIVRGGGRVVKNVSGYDLPRLVTGSLGSLGLITEVCFKLWPIGAEVRTVRVADPFAADALLYRPLAVIADRSGGWVFLAGTAADVEAAVDVLQGDARDGLVWPDDPDGDLAGIVRVPAGDVPDAVARIPDHFNYLAGVGVGEIRFGGPSDSGAVDLLRRYAEARGGSVVITRGGNGLDPWGTPPASLSLQARVKAAFDPRRVCNPGRLPGGL